jgi:hypothetical protein
MRAAIIIEPARGVLQPAFVVAFAEIFPRMGAPRQAQMKDVGTSRLAQGCCGQITVVDCEKFVGTPPAVRAYETPIPAKSLSAIAARRVARFR